MTDNDYMLRAIALAKEATGFTNPNPLVGAVIVKNGKIIGEGCHRKYGELHAERNAIASLSEAATGATMYVTLEPCCHYGKTPPCTDAIIENGIKRVVIGSRDPNPLVAGKGVKILREQGIEVVEDFLKEECDAINPVFFHYIQNKMPYVVMKYAMTADGKIATKTNASKWITGEKARQRVQLMRHQYMSILVGIGTVLMDDPMLTVREEGLKSPIRVICDSNLRIPLESKIVKSAKEYKTIVAHALTEEKMDHQKTQKLLEASVELVSFPGKNGKVDMKRLLQYLGEKGIDSILVEGGATMNDTLRSQTLIDRIEVFIAPKIFGGALAKGPLGGDGVTRVEDAQVFQLEKTEIIEDDVLLSYIRGNEKCLQEL